ncbi:hypothetical protein ACFWUZ_32735 [Streptomyces sp. NPDC058646]
MVVEAGAEPGRRAAEKSGPAASGDTLASPTSGAAVCGIKDCRP